MSGGSPVDGKLRAVLLRAVSAGDLQLPDGLTKMASPAPVQLRRQHRLARAHTFVAPRTAPDADGGESLEQLVECPLCRGRLADPRMLPRCQHCFCRACITDVAGGELSVACPVCGLSSELPSGGVSALPGNLYLSSLLRLLKAGGRPLSTPPTSDGSCAVCAQEGTGQRRLRACDHCGQGFCDACWSGHLSDVEDELNKMKTKLLEATEGIDRKENEFKEQCAGVRAQLGAAVDGRVAQLRRQQRDAEQALDDARQRAADDADALRRRLRDCADRLAQRRDKDDAFLSVYGETQSLMEEASKWTGGQPTFNSETLEVTLSEETAGNENRASGGKAPTENGTVNTMYRPSPRLTVRKHWLRRPAGVAACPWPASRHLLYVSAVDVVAVNASTGRLAAKFAVDGLLCASGIAFSDDKCYITDKYAHCVHELDAEGRLVASLGRKGGAPGNFRSPEGVAVGHDEAGPLIYVCDTGNDRVQVLRPDGTVVQLLGIRQLEDDPEQLRTEFSQPTGVAVTRDRIAVADCGNNRVKVYNMEGEKILELSGANGFFNTPECVAIDRLGRIIVGDSGNQRVQVFTEEGRLVCSLGGRGGFALGWVSGLAASPAGDLAVTDATTSALHVF